MRAAIRLGLYVVVAVLGVVTVGVSSASATEPWWHVNTISAPASQAGGESRLVLEVSNLGDADAEGSKSPVTIVDRLPAGITPTHLYPEGGGNFGIGINGVEEVIQCGFLAEVVTCTYAAPLRVYERFMINISVKAQPGAGEVLQSTLPCSFSIVQEFDRRATLKSSSW